MLHNLVCVCSPPSHLAPPWTPRGGVTAEGGESSCGSREGSWSHQFRPTEISCDDNLLPNFTSKKQPRQHTSWSMIDILLNVMFFLSFHTKVKVVEFSGYPKCQPLECPTQKFGQNVATQSSPIKSCLQSCSKVSGADFESSPGSKDDKFVHQMQGYSDIQCLFIVFFRSFGGVGTPKNSLCQMILVWYNFLKR